MSRREWDFGDGRAARDLNPSHAWAEPGFYDVTLSLSGAGEESRASRTFLVEANDPAGSCEAAPETLCLLDSRFAVTVDWRGADEAGGVASVARVGTNDSGLFWFFDDSNWEVLVKVLEGGCSVNGHVWVFTASTTDLGYTIRVEDTAADAEGGRIWEHSNAAGTPADAITDTRAFAGVCEGAEGQTG